MIKRKAVVLENEMIITLDIINTLKKHSYHAAYLKSTHNLIERVKQVNPDVIIMDTAIFENEKIFDLSDKMINQLKIPVILLTNNPHQAIKDKAKTVGIMSVLVKPFKGELLLKALKIVSQN